MKAYNPYDLIPLKINGSSTYGRPVEFDSVIADQKTLKNAFGQLVKPSRLSTTCNDCGQGFLFYVDLEEPPFSMDINCPLCKPVPYCDEPFVDPVKEGLVKEHEINPSLVDLNKGLEATETTVADRQAKVVDEKLSEEQLEEPAVVAEQTIEQTIVTEEEKPETKPKVKPKPPKKAKEPKAAKDTKKDKTKADSDDGGFIDYGSKRKLPKAEEMTPEVNLDELED